MRCTLIQTLQCLLEWSETILGRGLERRFEEREEAEERAKFKKVWLPFFVVDEVLINTMPVACLCKHVDTLPYYLFIFSTTLNMPRFITQVCAYDFRPLNFSSQCIKNAEH